ncbi:MAG: hypothetical protein HUJ26_08285 [Planctomycetaceae bacterium]|nr:hypothetical protein [Planctomycetaceae bacterium]
MNEPPNPQTSEPTNPAESQLRQLLLGLVSRLKPGFQLDLLAFEARTVLTKNGFEYQDLRTTLDRPNTASGGEWALCDGDIISVELVGRCESRDLSAKVTVPVGKMSQKRAQEFREIAKTTAPLPPHGTLILIGMPGTGKSTIGRLLAAALNRPFDDLDELIEADSGKALEQIIDAVGFEQFLELEADYARRYENEQAVLATGGSVVYEASAMLALQQRGTLIYLDTPLDELATRLSDLTQRGVVLQQSQSLEDLFHERQPLYECYYDLKIETSGLTAEETVTDIVSRLESL